MSDIPNDINDRATLEEERQRDAAIAAAHKPVRRLLSNGECHNCGDVIPEPKLFCDAGCADEYADFERRGLT